MAENTVNTPNPYFCSAKMDVGQIMALGWSNYWRRSGVNVVQLLAPEHIYIYIYVCVCVCVCVCVVCVFRSCVRSGQNIAGSQKEWDFQRVVLADVPPERKRTEGTFRCSHGTKTGNEGTFACSPERQTRTRAHSPKPPLITVSSGRIT